MRKNSFCAVLCLVLLPGCAMTFAHRTEPPRTDKTGAVHYLDQAPPVAQTAYQCGPAALESVVRYWGKDADAASIAGIVQDPASKGTFNFMLSQHARTLGFWTEMDATPNGGSGMRELKSWISRKVPVIAMVWTGFLWAPNYHFIVLKGYDDESGVFYANIGKPETYAISYREFEARWKKAGQWRLIVCPPERVDWDLDGTRSADLAFFCERKGSLDLAERWYRHALNKDPKDPALRFNLANIYLKTARFPEAEAIYTELLDEKPGWGSVSNNLAWLYLRQNRAAKAVSVVENAFKDGAERQPDILDTLGSAYLMLNDRDRAKECFLEAIGKVPTENIQASRWIHHHLRECAGI